MSKRNIPQQELNQVKQDIIELNRITEKFNNVKKSYEAKKGDLTKKIKNFMFIHGFEKGVLFRGEAGFLPGKIISCKKVVPTRIVWNIDEVEKRLGKKLSGRFINKRVEITDYKKMVELLKSHGVNVNEFKKLIAVEKTLDEKKLSNLEDLGLIEVDDLKGCCEIVEMNSYLKVTIKEDVDDNTGDKL